MTIKGLERQLTYLVHNPIRVAIKADREDAQCLQIKFTDGNIAYEARFYPIGGGFFAEIQQWLQLFFTEFECDFDYNTSSPNTTKLVTNRYFKEVDITFTIYYPNSHEDKTLSCKIINGYNNSMNNRDNFLDIFEKIYRVCWKGYPFSLLTSDFKNHLVFNGNGKFEDDSVRMVRAKNCDSIYVRWLGPDTNYNYWLFPAAEIKETTKEIGYKDRWFLNDGNETSNVDTLGLTSVKEFTLSDTINKKYWPLINTIFRSPEIYIYADLNHWQKVRIKGQSYSNKTREHAQKYTIEFFLESQYSQIL
jgi:hypothetical protein